MTAARSPVGGCVEIPESLNTTTPMRTDGGDSSAKASAAALAASIRLGATSVAAILPDTSKARRTVPSSRGTPMTLCGRARESTRIATPRTVKAVGIRRVHPTRRPGEDAAAAMPNCAARAARRRSRA
jgi:hypothetical protein